MRTTLKKVVFGDFPGGPVVKTLSLQSQGTGSIPGQRTKIPHAMWHGQKNFFYSGNLIIKNRFFSFKDTHLSIYE